MCAYVRLCDQDHMRGPHARGRVANACATDAREGTPNSACYVPAHKSLGMCREGVGRGLGPCMPGCMPGCRLWVPPALLSPADVCLGLEGTKSAQPGQEKRGTKRKS